MRIKATFDKFKWIKEKISVFFRFLWNKKIWFLTIILFVFIFYFFYIYLYINPSIYISPNLFTDSGKVFIMACVESSRLSSTFTTDEKKQIADLIENIFYQMSKKGKPNQIGIEFYFYKFKFIIKILWEVIELKKKKSQFIPERLQMVAARIVEELLYYSRKNPSSRIAKLIFYYYKKLLK